MASVSKVLSKPEVQVGVAAAAGGCIPLALGYGMKAALGGVLTSLGICCAKGAVESQLTGRVTAQRDDSDSDDSGTVQYAERRRADDGSSGLRRRGGSRAVEQFMLGDEGIDRALVGARTRAISSGAGRADGWGDRAGSSTRGFDGGRAGPEAASAGWGGKSGSSTRGFDGGRPGPSDRGLAGQSAGGAGRAARSADRSRWTTEDFQRRIRFLQSEIDRKNGTGESYGPDKTEIESIRKDIANQTREYFARNPQALERMKRHTWVADSPRDIRAFGAAAQSRPTPSGSLKPIRVINADCLDYARHLISHGKRVFVLNAGAKTHPGGAWRQGKGSQEEYLTRCSALVESLDPYFNKTDSYVGRVKKPRATPSDRGGYIPSDRYFIPETGLVISSHVPVVRGTERDGYPWFDRPFHVTIGSGALPDLNPAHPGNERQRFVTRQDRNGNDIYTREFINITEESVRNMYRAAIQAGSTDFVGGAWGCGAFHINRNFMAQVFLNVAKEDEFRGRLQLHFPIITDLNDRGNLDAFSRTLGGQSV